eukprot:TRINITY_DN2571_c0_g1_i3.p1 TRINITY_DN2571_c0_g1~~TRINITY_DN2571_c0_g1_i3.p1  ORF type:complete len:382 (-),score=124.40 TRINITY_DN2571_c0_g1_i3:129-1274(-)
MALLEGVSTLAAVASVFAADFSAGNTFVSPGSAQPRVQAPAHGVQNPAALSQEAKFVAQPLSVMQAKLGMSGLLAYGAGAGVLAAVVGRSRQAGRKVLRRAEGEEAKADIEVAEKETKINKLAYLDNIPRAIIEKDALEALLIATPKEEWENPPEDSNLWILKQYAETYGEGKATKMGWWDYFTKNGQIGWIENIHAGSDYQKQLVADRERLMDQLVKGILPMQVPGPSPGAPVLFETQATFKWRGPEPFAGDQVQSLVSDGLFAKQFINALAFYREGLKPWQRGIEIGMAHGYFIIGPFVTLGPLASTPAGPTAGLLAGCAVILIASIGGLLFGTVIKPPFFDEEGDEQGKGYTEMINWHIVGGLGGAGFAHALITLFAS